MPAMTNAISFLVFFSLRMNRPPSVATMTFICDSVQPTARPFISLDSITVRFAVANRAPVLMFIQLFLPNTPISGSIASLPLMQKEMIVVPSTMNTACGNSMSQLETEKNLPAAA